MKIDYSDTNTEKQKYAKRIIFALQKRKSDLERNLEEANKLLSTSGISPKDFDLEFGPDYL